MKMHSVCKVAVVSIASSEKRIYLNTEIVFFFPSRIIKITILNYAHKFLNYPYNLPWSPKLSVLNARIGHSNVLLGFFFAHDITSFSKSYLKFVSSVLQQYLNIQKYLFLMYILLHIRWQDYYDYYSASPNKTPKYYLGYFLSRCKKGKGEEERNSSFLNHKIPCLDKLSVSFHYPSPIQLIGKWGWVTGKM